MGFTSRAIRLRVIALALGLSPVAGLFAQQASLGDLAKQEAQRRQAFSQPSKVYTNADLPPSPFPAAPPAMSPWLPAAEPPAVQLARPDRLNDDWESRRSDFCQDCARDASGRIKRSEWMTRTFMEETGFPDGRPGWVVGHVRPLACGGADDPSNMQWQTRADADARDRIGYVNCQGEGIPQWQVPIVWPPNVVPPNILPPNCGGVNTARQQAMSNVMRDAGIQASGVALPPCFPATRP